MANEVYTARELLRSLGSTLCPTCGKTKYPKRTACGRCYHKLSAATKKALYARVGQGYEQAVAQVMVELGLKSILLPGEGDLFRPEPPKYRRPQR